MYGGGGRHVAAFHLSLFFPFFFFSFFFFPFYADEGGESGGKEF